MLITEEIENDVERYLQEGCGEYAGWYVLPCRPAGGNHIDTCGSKSTAATMAAEGSEPGEIALGFLDIGNLRTWAALNHTIPMVMTLDIKS